MRWHDMTQSRSAFSPVRPLETPFLDIFWFLDELANWLDIVECSFGKDLTCLASAVQGRSGISSSPVVHCYIFSGTIPQKMILCFSKRMREKPSRCHLLFWATSTVMRLSWSSWQPSRLHSQGCSSVTSTFCVTIVTKNVEVTREHPDARYGFTIPLDISS